MPVSKKRKKKRRVKPSGPPLSKKAIAARKRKLTKRQILIYVFSALIILSFALSFIIGFGGRSSDVTNGHSGVSNTSGENGSILFTPVPGEEDSAGEDNAESQDAIPAESDTEN